VRAERRHVRDVEVEKWLRATPSKSRGSSRLFRSLRDKGQTSTCSTYFSFIAAQFTDKSPSFTEQVDVVSLVTEDGSKSAIIVANANRCRFSSGRSVTCHWDVG